MISIKDVYNSLPENKNRNDSVFDRYVMRPLSIPASIPFIKHNMSANTVSWISLAAAVLGIFTTVKSYVYGGIVLLIWFILDNVDGNIARYKQDFTDYGDFIDSTSSFFIVLAILPAMGWNVSRGVEQIDKALMLIGLSAAVSTVLAYSRIIYQKYRVASFEAGIGIEVTASKTAIMDSVSKKSIMYIANRVEKDFGITGIFIPMLILSDVFEFKLLFLLLYMAYSLVTSFMTIGIVFLKIYRHEKKKQGKGFNETKIKKTGHFDIGL